MSTWNKDELDARVRRAMDAHKTSGHIAPTSPAPAAAPIQHVPARIDKAHELLLATLRHLRRTRATPAVAEIEQKRLRNDIEAHLDAICIRDHSAAAPVGQETALHGEAAA